MARRVGLGCLALLARLVALAAAFFLLQPTSFRIARSRTVASSPAAVRALVSDMARFAPVYAELGTPVPARTSTHSGTSGPGAWIETNDRGQVSRLTLVSADDAAIVFRSSMAGVDGVWLRFDLAPVATGTDVTAALANDMHGLARAIWPFVGLDGRLGPDLERMLATLDARLHA